MKKMLSPKEVEEFYGLNRGTLAYWRWANEGPKFHCFGKRCIRYDVATLETWINRHEVTPSALAIIGGR